MKNAKKNIEMKVIFIAVILLFLWFLAVPIVSLLLKSFPDGTGRALAHYTEVFSETGFWTAVGHSFAVAGSSAFLTTVLAFLLAYTVRYTNVPEGVKTIIRGGAVLPMLLPTITYGFAIIYTFGKQGLVTKIAGTQIFDIYGFGGLLLGYIIYILPVSFLLIHNTMGYIDKKFMIVSRIMGDGPWKTFAVTILRPLLGTLAASFVQCFFLAFTDFGIPASVGGQYEVVASVLYDEMLGRDQVIIYSNADDEAVAAMKDALDENGYEGQYTFQSFGTSELGGKLLAEGTDIEADLVTMSSFYLDSAQEQNDMFADLTFEADTLTETPAYYKPITSQEGAVIVNTQAMEEAWLPMPRSIKDLADPIYEGEVSVTDIKSSSTGWLMIQAVVSAYGEDGAKEVLTGIYKNAGPHMEDSGSGPIKKVRSGEVAIGFGLRHQAVEDKAEGMPIDYVDPVEGNFSLTESVAVIDKGESSNPKAMEMAECIIRHARAEIQKTYPNPLYVGETADPIYQSAYPKTFEEPLTAELLERHQALSESCMP